MTHLKTHYQEWTHGSAEALEQWAHEGLIPGKVKFCDGLMLSKERHFDFTKDTDGIDCKKCLKKIDIWAQNGFDLPYTG